MRTQHRKRFGAVLAVIAMTAATAACSGDDAPASPEQATAKAAAASPDPQVAAAEKSALAAYAGYLDASREAERSADPFHPELKKYLADPLLTRVRLAIRNAKEHGAMRTGKLISDPTVTAVSLDTVPPSVEIQDCLDATGYQLVYVKDKKVVPGSAAGRYLATATATRYPDGRWLISAGAAHQDQPC